LGAAEEEEAGASKADEKAPERGAGGASKVACGLGRADLGLLLLLPLSTAPSASSAACDTRRMIIHC
jgi:hypothetical protein